MIDTPAQVAEIAAGAYEIYSDGRFEVPTLPRALYNTGSTDCTIHIFSRDDIVECPCMVHRDRHGAHAAGTLMGEYTLFAGVDLQSDGTATRKPTRLINGFVPTGYPLTIRVLGFTAGEAPIASTDPEPEMLIAGEGSENAHLPVKPNAAPDLLKEPLRAAPTQVLTADQRAQLERLSRTIARPASAPQPTPLAQPAMLFPGFVVACERCGSRNVSLDTIEGRNYLECEACGAMCRVKL